MQRTGSLNTLPRQNGQIHFVLQRGAHAEDLQSSVVGRYKDQVVDCAYTQRNAGNCAAANGAYVTANDDYSAANSTSIDAAHVATEWQTHDVPVRAF